MVPSPRAAFNKIKVPMYLTVNVSVCVWMCVRACVCACMPVCCVCVCVHVCLCTCACSCFHMHACVGASRCASAQVCVPCTSIHVCTYAYLFAVCMTARATYFNRVMTSSMGRRSETSKPPLRTSSDTTA